MSTKKVREASAVAAILMIGGTAIGCSEEQGPADTAGESVDDATGQ